MRRFLGITIEPYKYAAPVQKSGSVVEHTFSMIPPHEVFAHLWIWDQASWRQTMFGASGACAEFWSRLEAYGPVWWLEHPRRSSILTPPDKCSPCLIWGDESAVNKERNRNIESYLFYSIVCELPSVMKFILIFTQCREWQIGHLTEYAALDVVAWSTNALSSGKWPKHNHENKLFTPKDGYRYENASKKNGA